MRKLVCVVLVCFIAAGLLSGCSVLQKLGLESGGSGELRSVSSIAINEAEAGKLTDKIPIHLYFTNADGTKLKLMVRYISLEEYNKGVNERAAAVMQELLKGPGNTPGYRSTIPEGSSLCSPVRVQSGAAFVDLNSAFVDKHPGGRVAEQLTIYSIVNSLTELKEIEKVRFTIEGKTRKDYKGNFKFDNAFPRAPSMISKVIENAAAGAAGGDSKDNGSGKDGKDNSKDAAGKKDMNPHIDLGGAEGRAQDAFSVTFE